MKKVVQRNPISKSTSMAVLLLVTSMVGLSRDVSGDNTGQCTYSFDVDFFYKFYCKMPTHVFNVEMTCEGCAKAITNVLDKHKDQGISNFVIDLKSKTVEIDSTLSVDQLTEILKKTGKTVSYLKEKK